MGVTRQTLYEEIWTEPITKVSKRYGVSDSFFIRILQRLNVPRPPMGYWAKLAVGKQLPKPVLPDPLPGDEIEWDRNNMPAARSPRELPKAPENPAPARAPRKRARTDQHFLLQDSLQHFQEVRESETGHLKPTKRKLVDLIVTKGTLERAFKVASALFLTLHDHGYRVMLAPHNQHFKREELFLDGKAKQSFQHPSVWSPGQPTLVYVGSVAIGLTIFEPTVSIKARYIDGRYVPVADTSQKQTKWRDPHDWTANKEFPTGILSIQTYSPYPWAATWKKQWKEEKGKSLKDLIDEIIRDLVTGASEIAAKVAEAERQAEIRRKEWEIERAQREKEEAEKKRQRAFKESAEDLLSIIDSWDAAKKLERFFADVEIRAKLLPEVERNQVLRRIGAAKAQLPASGALKRFLEWKNAEERLNPGGN